MNHETLQAMYQLDVSEVGEEEANARWEYWQLVKGEYDWSDGFTSASRRKPGIPWPKVMTSQHVIEAYQRGRTDSQQMKTAKWPDDAPEWANAAKIIFYRTSEYLIAGAGEAVIERPKPAKQKCKCCGQEVE